MRFIIHYIKVNVLDKKLDCLTPIVNFPTVHPPDHATLVLLFGRLAEIDAQLRAMRVIEKPDCDDETKSNINNSKSSSAVEDDAGVSGSGTERFTRDDAVSTGNDPRKDDSGAPGEIVLREQREMRQIRDHTRAIDAALEKVRS